MIEVGKTYKDEDGNSVFITSSFTIKNEPVFQAIFSLKDDPTYQMARCYTADGYRTRFDDGSGGPFDKISKRLVLETKRYLVLGTRNFSPRIGDREPHYGKNPCIEVTYTNGKVTGTRIVHAGAGDIDWSNADEI